VSFDWDSDEQGHVVTVLGVSVSRESYGEDADGHRGVLIDFLEFDEIKIEPPLAPVEQPKWEKFLSTRLEDRVIAAVREQYESDRADFLAERWAERHERCA
jgi:hypothetical protein